MAGTATTIKKSGAGAVFLFASVVSLLLLPNAHAGLISTCKTLLRESSQIFKTKIQNPLRERFAEGRTRFARGTDKLAIHKKQATATDVTTTAPAQHPPHPIEAYKSELYTKAAVYQAAKEEANGLAAVRKIELDDAIEKGIKADRSSFFSATDPAIRVLSEKSYKQRYAWYFMRPALETAALQYGDKAQRFFERAFRIFLSPGQMSYIFELAARYKVTSLGPSVRSYFYHHRDEQVKAEALKTLISLYKSSSVELFRKQLRRAIRDAAFAGDPSVRRVAILALPETTSLFSKADAWAIASAGIVDDSGEVRLTAYRFIVSKLFSKMSSDIQRTLLVAMVHDKVADIRELSIPLLSTLFDAEAIELLNKLLNDSDSDIRRLTYAYFIEEHMDHPATMSAWRTFSSLAGNNDLDAVVSNIVRNQEKNPALALVALRTLKAKLADLKSLGHFGDMSSASTFPLTEAALLDRRTLDPVVKISEGMKYQEDWAWARALDHKNDGRVLDSVFRHGTGSQIFLFVRQFVKDASLKSLTIASNHLRRRTLEDPSYKQRSEKVAAILQDAITRRKSE